MANDGALKLSHQDGFVLGLLAGVRHSYKNKLLVQGKPTVNTFNTRQKIIFRRTTYFRYDPIWGPQCNFGVSQLPMVWFLD